MVVGKAEAERGRSHKGSHQKGTGRGAALRPEYRSIAAARPSGEFDYSPGRDPGDWWTKVAQDATRGGPLLAAPHLGACARCPLSSRRARTLPGVPAA